MSRSRRKTAFCGLTTARSDKPYKVAEHRSERRTARVVIQKTLDPDDRRLYPPRCYGDPWLGPKDGKQPIDPNSRWMRK